MPMFSILCCTSGIAEQLSSLHALSSTIVLVIHQNSGWNIVANRYSDSQYTGPFSCTVWSVHVHRPKYGTFAATSGALFGAIVNYRQWPEYRFSSLITTALLVQKI